MRPYAPILSRTPACSIETAVGAATWPSGDHVWSGQIGMSVPNPRTVSRNTHFWNAAPKVCSAHTRMSKVCAPTAQYVSTSTTTSIALPANRKSVSFIAE